MTTLTSTNGKAQQRYLAVAGNIGVGKSSLVEFLCHRYDLKPYFEPNDENPYLEDFYADMGRYAFHSQIYFLGAKHKLHRELNHSPVDVIQDRTIWEDAEIFAEHLHRSNIMDQRDYKTYRALYESIRDTLRPPDLMIYLKCSMRTTRRRIKERGRPAEQSIPLSYLKKLQVLYDAWIDGYDLSPVVTLNTGKLDYITDMVDCHEVMSAVDRHFGRRQRLYPLRPAAQAQSPPAAILTTTG